ncbi:hypothetical protein [Luteimonas mephitis]|uniref:DUF7507 domain-containing protein n=1 Tax=Luteimonas mephitis TaxID=83615 RepID=UPI003A918F9A
MADSNGNTVLGDAGDVITYTFSVSNTGTVDLTNVVVSDAMPLARVHDRQPAGGRPMPAPSNNTYVITAADVTAGKVTNIATATGTPPGTDLPTLTSPPVDTPTAEALPALSLVKTAARRPMSTATASPMPATPSPTASR